MFMLIIAGFYFLKTIEMKIKMIIFLIDSKTAKINAKYISCDDSGENKAFQKLED
jgi:hypothetical protein